MSAYVTTYGSSYWAGVLFGLNPPPAEYWMALTAGEPGEGTDGTLLAALEPDAADGYARVRIPTGAAGWALRNNNVLNKGTVAFPTPTDSWGVIDHYALCDAASGGNVYCWARLLKPLELVSQVVVAPPPGSLQLTFDHVQNPVASI